MGTVAVMQRNKTTDARSCVWGQREDLTLREAALTTGKARNTEPSRPPSVDGVPVLIYREWFVVRSVEGRGSYRSIRRAMNGAVAVGLLEAEVRREVERLETETGWYQNVQLTHGIQTKTKRQFGEDDDHPKNRFSWIEAAVPEDMSGMSVLDVGCNAGYIALEAAKRGASRVVGIDANAAYIEQARFCARVLDADIEYEVMSTRSMDALEGKFDFVFFVGLLYHLVDPIEGIAAIVGKTQGKILCESAVMVDTPEVPLLRLVPKGNYVPTGKGEQLLPGRWHPSMRALEVMFEEHDMKVSQVFKRGGRGAVLAEM